MQFCPPPSFRYRSRIIVPSDLVILRKEEKLIDNRRSFFQEGNLKFKRKRRKPFVKESRDNLIVDQARSKDDPSSLLAQQLGLLKKCKKGGRRRECSRRSRHESVGAFSFRRRLFLDASLINIKQAARARAGIHAGETLPYFFTLEPRPGCWWRCRCRCTPFRPPYTQRPFTPRRRSVAH